MDAFPRHVAWIMSLFLAISITGCASDRSLRQSTDDRTIAAQVKAALLNTPDVSGTSILVEVHNGDVQLSGFVKSQAEAQRAVELAHRVNGVRSVINKMSIRS